MNREEYSRRLDKYRDTISKLFIDLSKIVFTGIVIGGIMPVFTSTEQEINIVPISAGLILSILSAWLGCRILKP